MTRSILYGIGLLFALYGLSCFVRWLASLFLRPVRLPYVVLPVTALSELPAGVLPALSYSADGLRFRRVMAVDAGIPEEEKEKFRSLCRRDNLIWCELDSLPRLIRRDICNETKNKV